MSRLDDGPRSLGMDLGKFRRVWNDAQQGWRGEGRGPLGGGVLGAC